MFLKFIDVKVINHTLGFRIYLGLSFSRSRRSVGFSFNFPDFSLNIFTRLQFFRWESRNHWWHVLRIVQMQFDLCFCQYFVITDDLALFLLRRVNLFSDVHLKLTHMVWVQMIFTDGVVHVFQLYFGSFCLLLIFQPLWWWRNYDWGEMGSFREVRRRSVVKLLLVRS